MDVVCFGMLCHCYLVIADAPAVHNGGARILHAVETYGDDAAIVATLLHDWEISASLICTALGDDDVGHRVANLLESRGVPAHIRFSGEIETEREVSVSDPTGARTYWQQRSPEVLATLATADISVLKNARLLYVDWYDGDYILRPMTDAKRRGVDVYLNLESQYRNSDLLRRLAPIATICQASADEPDAVENLEQIVETILAAGAKTAIVTGGSRGCMVARGGERLRVPAPSLPVVDGYGAGAAFSSGIIYGYLNGWSLEECARFATAGASLKCTSVGYVAFPVPEIKALATQLVSG